MMRVLVVSLQVGVGSSKGHINPLVGVVQWLTSDGHQVGWLPLPSAMGEVDMAQIKGLGVEYLQPPPLPVGVVPPQEELAALLADPQRAWEAHSSFLLDPIELLLGGLMQLIDWFRPDVALIDTLAYPGIVAAHRTGLPWVGVCTGLTLLHPPGFSAVYHGDMSRLVPTRAAVFAGHSLAPDFRLFDCPSPEANVVFCTREFVGDTNPPANTWLVGPSIPPRARGDETDFPFGRLPADRPLVYASFGSVHSRLDLDDVIGTLATATTALGATLVIGSESVAARAPELPPHVFAVPYAPQLALLERASVFVTHGGANSVMEGLYCGVPLLVVPLAGDQPLQAMLVDRAGAGAVLERERLTAGSVAAALARLLERRGSIHRTVTRIRAAYRANDGARLAARVVTRTTAHS
jgi:zeaxanthin glucosyltransferase